ncbi:hypothetical protein HELRODRAFT_177393 [Helobdella robusta]|uniref:C-type lectin domain-containing protein n=1 Tax=Helobdella robusta TaxID=6412 RepID=T1FBM0_HELRO|nr:hypothetical protein HELRODRAFT_177393 [Helobdella robusta]ESN98150.1 hypothetical protein HELRODRAFT_177393 [Helobdella robusta]
MSKEINCHSNVCCTAIIINFLILNIVPAVELSNFEICYNHNSFCLKIHQINSSEMKKIFSTSNNVCPAGKKLLEIRREEEQTALDNFLMLSSGKNYVKPDVKIPLYLSVTFLSDWRSAFTDLLEKEVQTVLKSLNPVDNYVYINILRSKSLNDPSSSYSYTLQSDGMGSRKLFFVCHLPTRQHKVLNVNFQTQQPNVNQYIVTTKLDRFEAANYCFKHFNASLLAFDMKVFCKVVMEFLFLQPASPPSVDQNKPPLLPSPSWWLLNSKFQLLWSGQRNAVFTNWAPNEPKPASKYAYIQKSPNEKLFRWHTTENLQCLGSPSDIQNNINNNNYNNINNNNNNNNNIIYNKSDGYNNNDDDDDDDGKISNLGDKEHSDKDHDCNRPNGGKDGDNDEMTIICMSDTEIEGSFSFIISVVSVVIAIFLTAIIILAFWKCCSKIRLKQTKTSGSENSYRTQTGTMFPVSRDDQPNKSFPDSNAEPNKVAKCFYLPTYETPLSVIRVENVYESLGDPQQPTYLELYDD